MYDAIVPAPFGAVAIRTQDDFIVSIVLLSNVLEKPATDPFASMVAAQVSEWLQDYRSLLEMPMAVSGTPFQKRVWKAISQIPAGKTLTYGELADKVGSGPRAVANVCGANKVPLFVPCHRVVAKSGLGGFMQGNPEGLSIKTWLLAHEGVNEYH